MKLFIVFALGVFAILSTGTTAFAQTATQAGLPGSWHFVLDTPGGDRESDADFHLDGSKVTGKYGKADVAGTFENGKMDLAFPVDTEEAGSGTLKLTGTLDADAITGNWTFAEYNGTFKATRKAAAPAPAQ